jgi:hypothetical protein
MLRIRNPQAVLPPPRRGIRQRNILLADSAEAVIQPRIT